MPWLPDDGGGTASSGNLYRSVLRASSARTVVSGPFHIARTVLLELRESVCVCVCKKEREGERERGKKRETKMKERKKEILSL